MVVEEKNIIAISYELRDSSAEGEVLEVTDINHPLQFFFGGGQLLPAFERHLQGLTEGSTFHFTLIPAEAYGEIEADNIVDLPRDIFQDTDEAEAEVLIEGNFISLTDNNGYQHHGTIVSFNEETVKIDFNHPMAGKTLYFSGVILNIRKATVDELAQLSHLEEDGIRGLDWG
jgi:FKBP-type peptidyl-prolyl cis-trans isomerase SlyD